MSHTNVESQLIIAGVRCQMQPDCGDFAIADGAPRAFVAPECEDPDLVLRLTPCPSDAPPAALPAGTQRAPAEQGDAFHFLRRGGSLCARERFSRCHAWIDAATAAEPFTGQPWLMLALWGYLAHRNGLFLHGAFCELAGRFFLLLGPQQVGKSTLARLVAAAGGACVTDENPFLTREASGLVAHGSPWTGIQGTPTALSAPPRAIFFLRQAPQNTLTHLRPAEAAQRLLRNNRFFTWSAETVPPALELIEELSQAVPIYDYGFVPQATAVERLAEVL